MMVVPLVVALALGQAGQAPPGPGQPAPVPPAPGQPVPPQPPAPVLTLEEALRQAEAQNLDLKAARARLAQSRELSARVWTGYLPQLSAGASYTRNSAAAEIPFPDFSTPFAVRDVGTPTSDAGGTTPAGPLPGTPTTLLAVPTGFQNITIQPFNQYAAQILLSQAIIAPPLFPAIRNAYLAEEIAEVSTENARREILFGVAQLYYGAVGLKQSLEVQQRLLETRRAHEKDARVRYEAGTTPKVALLRAEIDRATAEQDVKRAENAHASAKVSLATLLDRDPDFEVEVPAAPATPEDGAALEDAALRDRPDVRAARQSEELARRNRTAVFYRYLPSLGANGVYRWSNVGGFTGEPTSWAVTLGVNWLLFDGGLREVELRENRARVREAEANRESAENRARDEVRRARLDLDSALANRVKAEEQVALARENARLVDASFRAGAATYLDVADAQTALRNSELGSVGERLNADLAALRLLRAAGAFNPGG